MSDRAFDNEVAAKAARRNKVLCEASEKVLGCSTSDGASTPAVRAEQAVRLLATLQKDTRHKPEGLRGASRV
jgi:hypothetical protein